MKPEPFQARREMRFRDIHGVHERPDEKNQIREDAR